VGYAVPVIGLQLILDARWRGFLSGEPGGVQVGAGLGFGSVGRRGRGKVPTEPAVSAPETGTTGSMPTVAAGSSAQRRGEVVATARQVMGQPYRYGGEGDGGFDCSGLIQYAYASHGVTVPRVSTDQAQVGEPVARALDELEPGDILTFSASPGGGRVSHVGLYVGEGRFIHSASSKGVSESRLSAEDPNGAWWYARWVGARRIIVDP
jgi:cell wall-associated NlpC family hydrolase